MMDGMFPTAPTVMAKSADRVTGLRPLHPHQVTALDQLKGSIQTGHNRPMLMLPTGAGKTVLAAHIVAGALRKGKRVCFVVPALSLVDQTFERFVENGIDPADMGIIQANHPCRRPSAPVQIATAQTLTRRDRPVVDVVVIDEAHVRYSVYEAWMADCGYHGCAPPTELPPITPRTLFIGLSATPWAKGLGKQFDDLIRPTTMSELIAAGFLSPFRVFAPSRPDLTGVKIVAGDYHEGQLEERMSEPLLVADVVKTWCERGNDQPTLCFAVGRNHAKLLADQFAKAGIASAYIDANTPREERERIGKSLADGQVKVVVNIGCLTTGVDWDVRCLILARPTKSQSLFVQIIGRALRTAPGKGHAIILDHSDTHARLGLVTDIDHDTLHDGSAATSEARKKDEDKTPLPILCPSCTALMPNGSKTCLACGSEMPVKAGIKTEDGELVEITGKAGKRPKDLPVKTQLQRMGKQSVYSQLVELGYARGKGEKWADGRYKDIFDVWPRGLHKEPIPYTPLLLGYVRSRAIAWSKSQQRGCSHA